MASPGSSSSREKRLDLGIGPDVFLDHALLLEHFGGVLEALVLEQPVHQFLARIVVGSHFGELGIARQQHADLMWIRVAAM